MININKSEEDEIKTTSQILKKFSINNISSFAKNIIATNIKKEINKLDNKVVED